MWGKVFIFVLGATIGWVIGARSGRQAYERVAGEAARVWESPQVRRVTGTIRRRTRDIPHVGEAASDAMQVAAERADEFADRHDND